MKDIYEILKNLNIDYIKHDHPALHTCEEAEKYYNDITGGKSKNLFIRNNKGDKFYLVIIETDKKIDFKKLSVLLNEKKLSFASPEQLKDKLNLIPGSVSPFGLINNKDKDVIVIIDKDLWNYERLNYHPNINTSTLEIGRDDFQNFLDWRGNQVKFVEF